MNFVHQTPEALLHRSDSKNPATTCKGITSNGRPCRRALALPSPKSSPASSKLDRGVLAVLRDEQDDGNQAAAFYCWQHKNQADQLAATIANRTEVLPIVGRTSVDTIIDRLGILDLDHVDGLTNNNNRRRKEEQYFQNRDKMPAGWHDMSSPLMMVPKDVLRPKPISRPSVSHGRSNTKASIFCCVTAADDEDDAPLPPQRRAAHGRENMRPHRVNGHPPDGRVPRPGQTGEMSQRHRHPQPPPPVHHPRVSRIPEQRSTLKSQEKPLSLRPSMSSSPNSTESHTQSLLAFIPPSLSPQTTSLLLTELTKPISAADGEGYIYMFWLTPESALSRPDDDIASTLLDEPTSLLPQERRVSDLLNRYATQRQNTGDPGTVLLKIGRATNVHRRLSQWSKQCSHNITLIRYYPYKGSSSPPAVSPMTPRKVPCVQRVERLIHLELAAKRVEHQGACQSCGREHREWFEIEATRGGLRAVDEVIRRWVNWAEHV